MSAIPGIRAFAATPPALPGGGQFPVEFVIGATAEPETILKYAEMLQTNAAASGMFAFPPIIDTKIDQPEVELVMDRDKVASMGLNMATVGADLSTLVGGNFVNRFNLDGRSYKVIPQVKRIERLNASQLENTYVKGPNGQLVPLSTFATLEEEDRPALAQSLPAVQRRQDQRRGRSGPSTRRCATSKPKRRKILPKGYKIDYTGESRQLRVEGSKFLPAFLLALVLIFLVLAAQFNSFRDPLIILLGSVPLAMFGALMFSFLKMPGANTPFFTNGWTTTLEHLLPGRPGHPRRPGLEERHSHRPIRQRTPAPRPAQTPRRARSRPDPPAPRADDQRRDHLRSLPAHAGPGAGAAARNSIGITIVAGMALGTLFTLLVIPSIYVLIAKQHAGEQGGALARGLDLSEPALEDAASAVEVGAK